VVELSSRRDHGLAKATYHKSIRIAGRRAHPAMHAATLPGLLAGLLPLNGDRWPGRYDSPGVQW